MIVNDIAVISQTEDKVSIVLKEPYMLRGLKLTENEELNLLALFSLFIRAKTEVKK